MGGGGVSKKIDNINNYARLPVDMKFAEKSLHIIMPKVKTSTTQIEKERRKERVTIKKRKRKKSR